MLSVDSNTRSAVMMTSLLTLLLLLGGTLADDVDDPCIGKDLAECSNVHKINKQFPFPSPSIPASFPPPPFPSFPPQPFPSFPLPPFPSFPPPPFPTSLPPSPSLPFGLSNAGLDGGIDGRAGTIVAAGDDGDVVAVDSGGNATSTGNRTSADVSNVEAGSYSLKSQSNTKGFLRTTDTDKGGGQDDSETRRKRDASRSEMKLDLAALLESDNNNDYENIRFVKRKRHAVRNAGTQQLKHRLQKTLRQLENQELNVE